MVRPWRAGSGPESGARRNRGDRREPRGGGGAIPGSYQGAGYRNTTGMSPREAKVVSVAKRVRIIGMLVRRLIAICRFIRKKVRCCVSTFRIEPYAQARRI